jgi:hypothetical protein
MYRLSLAIILLLFPAVGLIACAGPDESTPPATPGTVIVITAAPAIETGEVAATEELPPVEIATTEPTPTTATALEPTAMPTPESNTLCPDVPRPALLLFNGTNYELTNPLSGERCRVSLPPEDIGPEFIAGERIYFLQRDMDGPTVMVSRLNPDGTREALPETQLTGDLYFMMQFAVAPDESHLAWSRVEPQGDSTSAAILSQLLIGQADGSQAVIIVEEVVGEEYAIDAPAKPIRFSADGQTLFFTWQPWGLGGMWNFFNGRYHNLYRVFATGGEPEKVFDCVDLELFLCLGDFRDDGTLAYIDTDRIIHVIGPDGSDVAAISTAGDYAGYPTFNANGDLFFSTAILPAADGAFPFPAPGTVYRVAAPYTGEPEAIASAEGLLTSGSPNPFLDNNHLVAQYAEGDRWGNALLSVTGEITLLEPWPHAYLAAVWPAE